MPLGKQDDFCTVTLGPQAAAFTNKRAATLKTLMALALLDWFVPPFMVSPQSRMGKTIMQLKTFFWATLTSVAVFASRLFLLVVGGLILFRTLN